MDIHQNLLMIPGIVIKGVFNFSWVLIIFYVIMYFVLNLFLEIIVTKKLKLGKIRF